MNEDWVSTANAIRPDPDEVHIWRFRSDRTEDEVGQYQQILSPEEGARASRLHKEMDRNRFTSRRGVLRTILSRYLHESPADVQLIQQDLGRPEVITKDPRSALKFSTSHSHEWALCAVTSDERIGVDIELLDLEFQFTDVVRHYFSPAETKALNALEVTAQAEAFFRIWTQKEAYVKALGRGLLVQLPDLAGSFVEFECSVRLPDSEGDFHDWYRLTFINVICYLATVLISQTRKECRFFEYLQ